MREQGPHRPTSRRRWSAAGRARTVGSLLTALLAVVTVSQVLTSAAAFTVSTANPANGWSSDTLQPPSGFTASVVCGAPPAPIPSYRTRSLAPYTSSASSYTVTKPASLVIGELMLAHLAVASGPNPSSFSAPAGWTLLRSDSNPGNLTAMTWYKVATSTETAATNFTFSQSAGSQRAMLGISVYTGVHTTSPINAHGGRWVNNNSSFSAPSLSTTFGNTRVVGTFSAQNGSSSVSFSPPSGMTERWDQGTDGVSQETTDEGRGTPGGTGTRTATSSSSYPGIAQLLALNPTDATVITAPGALPAHRAQSVKSNTSSTSSMVISRPAGTVADDLLLARVVFENAPLSTSITVPSGWVAVRTDTYPGQLSSMIWYRFATGSDPSSWTWSYPSGTALGHIIAYSGVDKTMPVGDHSGRVAVTGTGTATTSFTGPDVQTRTANSLLVGTFTTTATTSFTPPAGMTERYDVAGFTTTQTAAFEDRGTAGAVGARTATAASAGYGFGQLVVLNPVNTAAAPAAEPVSTTPEVGPAPALRSSSYTPSPATSRTSLVLAKPAGVVTDDVLVAQLAFPSGPQPVSITAPTGWTLLRSDSQPGSLTAMIYYRVATASEPASWTWTSSSTRAAGGVAAYSDVDTKAPIDEHGGQWRASSTASFTAASVTPSVPNTTLVGTFTSTGNVTFTAPAGMTAVWGAASGMSSGWGISSSSADQALSSAGPTGTRTATPNVSADGFAQVLTLTPVGGAPTSTGSPAPTWRASNTRMNTSDTTSFTVTQPSGTAEDDLLLASITYDNGPLPSSITPPTGWTLLRADTDPGQLTTMTYYKVATASEPASYTWTSTVSGKAVGGISAYSGVDPNRPIDMHGGQYYNNARSLTAPSIVTKVDNVLLIGTFHSFRRSFSPPSGMTERWDLSNGSSDSDPAQESTQQVRAAAGSTGTRTATASDDLSRGFATLVALTPVPSTATQTGISVSASWTATPSTYATGYTLQRFVGTSVQRQQAVPGRTTTTATDGPLTNGTTYTYVLFSLFGTWTSTEQSVTVTPAC